MPIRLIATLKLLNDLKDVWFPALDAIRSIHLASPWGRQKDFASFDGLICGQLAVRTKNSIALTVIFPLTTSL